MKNNKPDIETQRRGEKQKIINMPLHEALYKVLTYQFRSFNLSFYNFIPLRLCASATRLLCLFILLNIPSAHTSQNHATITPELRSLLEKAITASDSFTDRFHAEVWLSDMSVRLKKYVPNNQERIQILQAAHYEANRAKLAPELVLAVMHVESRFDRFAISRVGARGLMQVMPFWIKELNQPKANLFDITTNLRFGCTILKYYLDKEKGNMHKALARYNGSYGKRKYPDKVFTALSERWYKN